MQLDRIIYSSYLNPVVEIVQHEDPVASDLLCLQHGLEVGQQLHVLAHVSGQHHVYHHLSHGDPLLVGQGRKNITFGVLNTKKKLKEKCKNSNTQTRN